MQGSAACESYLFDSLGDAITTPDEKLEPLKMALGAATDAYVDEHETKVFPYLDEIDSQKYMGVRAEYIEDGEWAVLVTRKMEDQVTLMVNALKAACGLT